MLQTYTLIAMLCLLPIATSAREGQYSGTWNTTNRKLDGPMICDVKSLGEEKWQGRFYGVWQGVPFDYKVAFAGPASALQGTATIDGAHYTWTGIITEGAAGEPRVFKGRFGGSRYAGYFDLKEKSPQVAAAPARLADVRIDDGDR